MLPFQARDAAARALGVSLMKEFDGIFVLCHAGGSVCFLQSPGGAAVAAGAHDLRMQTWLAVGHDRAVFAHRRRWQGHVRVVRAPSVCEW